MLLVLLVYFIYFAKIMPVFFNYAHFSKKNSEAILLPCIVFCKNTLITKRYGK